MFEIIKSWFSKKPVQSKPVWVGTVEADWIDENGRELCTFFTLYENNIGTRSYKVTGDCINLAEKHRQYSRVVVPWVGGCEPAKVFDKLVDYNEAYWLGVDFDNESPSWYSSEQVTVEYVPTTKKRSKKKKVVAASDSNVVQFPTRPKGAA